MPRFFQETQQMMPAHVMLLRDDTKHHTHIDVHIYGVLKPSQTCREFAPAKSLEPLDEVAVVRGEAHRVAEDAHAAPAGNH
jgi:hypothetical protein